jgi:isoleucyl-tRNA synthetase
MKFKQGTRKKAIEYEKDLATYWQEHKTFEKSVEMRPKSNNYVFYDGPPFITGVPHHGTLLSSVVKDAVPRYWTMKGKRVERVWGWDCHGLPAEVFTEKKLGIQDKRDIGTKVSLEEYITTCRENMVQTGSLWEDTINRIGRWVDFKGAYKTMDKDYMESVWWAFKKLYERGKIYEGEKVLMYCIRDATPISKAEVAMDNSYQDVTDPSVYVKFKLKDEDAYLLAWTTTPWTLPSNSAIAVNKDLTYSEVEVGDEKFILAEALLDKALTDEKHAVLPYKVLRTFKGKELVGKSYEPIIEDNRDRIEGDTTKVYKVWHADFVHAEEGTGIAHESPAYGEEDYELSKKEGFPWILNTDENGQYVYGPWEGKQVWEANKEIAKTLLDQGVVWKIDYITHSYPHCHRCHSKLIYRAHPSWFMDIQGQKEKMLEDNGPITWFPEHIKQGRFAKTVESAPDWNLSRDRFWATAMPVWKGTDKHGKEHIKVVGSYTELKELSGRELDDYHRPWVDDVTFTIDGVKYERIDKVLDCWFESGSMPFAQFHYPFENVEKFENSYPGDFIAEYVGQVRAWFYYLHAVGIGLFDKHAFKNVIVTGTVAGNDGRKMSKNFGNYTDPNELMDAYSADALRFLLLSSPLLNGEDFALLDKEVADVQRKLAMIWNMYDFFTMYADVDKWEWDGKLEDPTEELSNPLDEWVVSRVHQLSKEVDEHMQRYDVPNAMKPMLEFIDDASNWYVRRSRKRFWKSDNDSDKNDAYRTLHYVLVQISMILAPFTPFLSEELYRNLTDGESVHLLDWPETGHINELLLEDMALTRMVITEALAARAEAKLKVRQPLTKITVITVHKDLTDYAKEIIREEVNVKEVECSQNSTLSHATVLLDTHITPALKREGLMREVVRNIQSARKQADLQVDDRINLTLKTEDKELLQAIEEHKQTIMSETLSSKLHKDTTYSFGTTVKIEDKELGISLEKAG